MAEYTYLDTIDTAIMTIMEESETATVRQVSVTLSDRFGINLDIKRVRHRLNSLVKYTYLDSVKEPQNTGGYCLIYSLRRAVA